MNDKVSITLSFDKVISFEVNDTHVEVKVETEDGGWKLSTFPKEDVTSFHNYTMED